MQGSFLSNAELEKIINDVSKSKTGKAAIESATGGKVSKFVARFDNGAPTKRVNTSSMLRKAEEMKDTLYQHITSDTQINGRKGLSEFPRDAIVIEKPVALGQTGTYRIDISFNADSLRRQSLVPDLYPNGVTDIISLFVHGYTARNSVIGSWHDEDGVWSLLHRDPNDFMTRAVDEFNSRNQSGRVRAVLVKKYT